MIAERRRTKRRTKLIFEDESYLIRGACFAVYKNFRNTQKEIVYQRSLFEELKTKGFYVEKEKSLPVYYLGKKVGVYIPDLVINNVIIVELKAKPFIHKDDLQQFWHYLKNSEFKLGFLVNFGEPDGVKIIRKVYDSVRRSSALSSKGSAE